MEKIKTFIQSDKYIISVFTFTLISWSFLFETPPFYFNIINMFGILALVFIASFALFLFKNTLYAIPPLIGLLFVVNHPSMTFDTTTLIFPIIAFLILISGFGIYIYKYRPTFKIKTFFYGFLLIAIAYVIPLVYTPFQFKAIPISFIAFIYFGLYVFFSNTVEGSLDYLFKILLAICLLMSLQMTVYLTIGFFTSPELGFYDRLFVGWDRNLGWANVNDMCFYIALTFPSFIYFIFKKPKTYALWFLMLLPILIIILSKSRGGMIGFGVAVAGIIYFSIYQGQKIQWKHGLLFLLFLFFFFLINRDIIIIWWRHFNDTTSGTINEFSSNRLFLYREAWKMFLNYPIFGAGWMSIDIVYQRWFETYGLYQRLFMYHSTFFHTIATMGLFGLFALIVHYTQVFRYMFKDVTLEKYLFVIGYLASQIHGLIDNVQFAVPYSVLMVLFLSIFETAQKKTSFELVNLKYQLIETSD